MNEYVSVAPVRSFDEIADILGVTRQAAHQAYKSGMRKLRRVDWTDALDALGIEVEAEPEPEPRPHTGGRKSIYIDRVKYQPGTTGTRLFRRDHGLCVRCGDSMGDESGHTHFKCRLKHNADNRAIRERQRQQVGGAA